MDIEEQYDKIYHYCYFKIYDKQFFPEIEAGTTRHGEREDSGDY